MFSIAKSWQLRLEEHFTALSQKGKANQRPFFAIEHGLEANEIKELQGITRALLKTEGLRRDHWLLWIVYAVEYGYEFDGVQFWEGFSERTPGWETKGDRTRIRDWFNKFHKELGGISPKGKWADHFSIIAWPITHAILPRDLQRRLAQAIYEAQYELRDASDKSTAEVGRILSKKASHSTRRFQLFLEQEELTGQLIISLLDSTRRADDGVERSALARIVRDLSAMSDAREWLQHARKTWSTAKPSIRMLRQTQSHIGEEITEHRSSAQKSISLKLKIEATRSPNQSWQFELIVPSFKEIAAKDSHFRDYIFKATVSVPIIGIQSFPGEWLLVGVRRRILKKWPEPNVPLLHFNSDPPFGDIAEKNIVLPSKKIWAFKIQSDETGRLINGDVLQPGQSYLLVAPSDRRLDAFAPLVHTDCDGIIACLYKVPQIVDAEAHKLLKSVGLRCALYIDIAAIGVPPVQWNAEVGGEWLLGDTPMLSVARNHDVSKFKFTLNQYEAIEYLAKECSTIVELPGLTEGRHTFRIQAIGNAEDNLVSETCLFSERTLTITIRAPRPWMSGGTNQVGMFVTHAPLNPSIEGFLSNSINLEVLGSGNIACTIDLVLKDSFGKQIWRKGILKQSLPITHDSWCEHYQQFLRSHSANTSFYECNTAYLDISSAEFGNYRIDLERHFAPVRWLLTGTDTVPVIKLITHGSENSLRASFTDFRYPLHEVQFTEAACRTGKKIDHPGGLLCATAGETTKNVIFTQNDIHGAFSDLKIPCSTASIPANCDLYTVIEKGMVWSQAKPLTHLARIWQSQISNIFSDVIIGRVCGKNWLTAEHQLRDEPENDKNWEQLEALVARRINVGISVSKLHLTADTKLENVRSDLLRILQKNDFSIDADTLHTVWKLGWSDDSLPPLTKEECDMLVRYGPVARAVRLLRLRSLHNRFSQPKESKHWQLM